MKCDNHEKTNTVRLQLYDSTYMRYPQQSDSETEGRRVAARDGGQVDGERQRSVGTRPQYCKMKSVQWLHREMAALPFVLDATKPHTKNWLAQ